MLFYGTLALFFGLYFLQLPAAVASLSWPTIDGSILSSEVYEQCCGEYSEGWFAKVSYRYSLAGREYISDKVELVSVGDSNTGYFAHEVIRRYPVGKTVAVYYNPSNPGIAVLEPGIPNDHYLFFLIQIVIALAAVFLCLGLLGILGIIKLPSSAKSPARRRSV
jgi:hypothetical protein